MITIIDNYDSFTYNLVQYLGDLGAETVVHRNDRISVDAVIAAGPSAIILSPGPGRPDKAGICIDLIRRAGAETPILGVCLGLQAIGEAFGGSIVRAPVQMHGKLSEIRHQGTGIFEGLENGFQATRYHSLAVDRSSVPDCLEITAETDDCTIMGLSHRSWPVHGVQFHPESIASEHGHELLRNFLNLAQGALNRRDDSNSRAKASDTCEGKA